MQGLVVVGLIFEEIPNINVKLSKSLEGICRVSTSRRSTIQGLVVEGLTVEDI